MPAARRSRAARCWPSAAAFRGRRGGLSEDQSGSTAIKSQAALDWYDTYLRESPNGSFVRAVLGRKMVLVQRLRGSAAARPIAAEYLQRFSDGPYAGTAKKLVDGR